MQSSCTKEVIEKSNANAKSQKIRIIVRGKTAHVRNIYKSL